MTRFLAIAAVLATTLALTSTTEAGPKGSTGHSSSHSMHQGSTHQGSNSHSMHSHDSHYRNWSSWNWNSRYRCYFYFCPTDNCNYYWYAPSCCYYPMSCIDQYPPTQCSYQQQSSGVAPVPVQTSTPNQITNVNTNSNAAANGVALPK